MTDEYAAYGTELETDIQRLRRLRDAQVPDSARAAQFQAQIDLLTDRFTALAGRAPALRDMDQRVADVEQRRSPVAIEVAWRGGLVMRSKWWATTAGAVAFAVLGVVAGWSWLAVLVLAVVAAACGVRTWAARNLRRQADADLLALDAELDALTEQQAQLRGAPAVVES
jgi:Flp pilus assembly protein TadB